MSEKNYTRNLISMTVWAPEQFNNETNVALSYYTPPHTNKNYSPQYDKFIVRDGLYCICPVSYEEAGIMNIIPFVPPSGVRTNITRYKIPDPFRLCPVCGYKLRVQSLVVASLAGTNYLHAPNPPPPPPPQDAPAINLHNDLPCNDTCSVNGKGFIHAKDPRSRTNFLQNCDLGC